MLQPYVVSVASRPCRKLTYKYFGPFTVSERIGTLAYRLELPQDSRIHPVFHVSQLKPFTPNYSPVFSELPKIPDLTTAQLAPTAILERRMVKKGAAAMVQLRIQWSNLPADATTWEDYASCAIVSPTPSSGTMPPLKEGRMSHLLIMFRVLNLKQCDE